MLLGHSHAATRGGCKPGNVFGDACTHAARWEKLEKN